MYRGPDWITRLSGFLVAQEGKWIASIVRVNLHLARICRDPVEYQKRYQNAVKDVKTKRERAEEKKEAFQKEDRAGKYKANVYDDPADPFTSPDIEPSLDQMKEVLLKTLKPIMNVNFDRVREKLTEIDDNLRSDKANKYVGELLREHGIMRRKSGFSKDIFYVRKWMTAKLGMNVLVFKLVQQVLQQKMNEEELFEDFLDRVFGALGDLKEPFSQAHFEAALRKTEKYAHVADSMVVGGGVVGSKPQMRRERGRRMSTSSAA